MGTSSQHNKHHVQNVEKDIKVDIYESEAYLVQSILYPQNLVVLSMSEDDNDSLQTTRRLEEGFVTFSMLTKGYPEN